MHVDRTRWNDDYMIPFPKIVAAIAQAEKDWAPGISLRDVSVTVPLWELVLLVSNYHIARDYHPAAKVQ